MYDVIAIGSATRDVYIRSKAFRVIEDTASHTGKSIALDLGSKITVDEVHFETGGTALNAAVTFGTQGLRTGIVSRVGDDARGEPIFDRAKEVGADMLVPSVAGAQTAYSLIVNAAREGRSILVYRGLLDTIRQDEIPWERIKNAKWIYLTHLAGKSAEQFSALVEYATAHGVAIAMNPGQTQLQKPESLKDLLAHTDILFVNEEEADYLGDLQELTRRTKGLVVITKGAAGVVVSDGATLWQAGILREPVFKDRTGAGDAFGSGFTTARIQGKSIEESLQFASANATGVLGEWGSNRGLLGRNEDPHKYGMLHITKTAL